MMYRCEEDVHIERERVLSARRKTLVCKRHCIPIRGRRGEKRRRGGMKRREERRGEEKGEE